MLGRASRDAGRLLLPSGAAETSRRSAKARIQHAVETAPGRSLLRGEIRDGDALIVDYVEQIGALTFTPKPGTRHPQPDRAGAGGDGRAPEAGEE